MHFDPVFHVRFRLADELQQAIRRFVRESIARPYPGLVSGEWTKPWPALPTIARNAIPFISICCQVRIFATSGLRRAFAWMVRSAASAS